MNRYPSNILRGLASVGLAGTLACGASDPELAGHDD